MPYQKDVPERKWWWCPKWYWPFAVCSGIRNQHKWCYNFSWMTYAEYLLVKHWEGCENGKLYTWSEPTFGVSKTTYVIPVGETCFDSSRGDSEGVCDPSNVGMMASQLTRAAPQASSIDLETVTLNSTVSDSGTFHFDGEYESRCRKGAWPWTLSLHEEMVTADVSLRNMHAQWTIAGIPISDAAGELTLAVACSWPMPLPNGHSQNRAVKVRYTLEQQANKSTLKLYNDPQDGCYTLSLGMQASAISGEASTSSTSVAFHGQRCDFDPQQMADLIKCWISQIVIPYEPRKFERPAPDDYVVVVDDTLWRAVPAQKRPLIELIVGAMTQSLVTAPAIFAEATTLLEQQSGIIAAARFVSVQNAGIEQGNCGFCQQVSSLAKPIAVGALAIGAIYLVRRLLRSKRDPQA